MIQRALAVVGITAWMTLCDRFFHVATTTVVHFWHPMVGDQTVWVIAVFGLASIGIVATAPKLAADQARPLRFVAELAVMTTIYGTSGFYGHQYMRTVTAAYAALFLIRLAASRDRGPIITAALLLAVLGPAFESLQWRLGMFEYTNPDFIGVPWWLFPFYANGAWAVRELGALIRRPVEDRQAEPVTT